MSSKLSNSCINEVRRLMSLHIEGFSTDPDTRQLRAHYDTVVINYELQRVEFWYKGRLQVEQFAPTANPSLSTCLTIQGLEGTIGVDLTEETGRD